jgi:simple sugar transport system substrate-binding protein
MRTSTRLMTIAASVVLVGTGCSSSSKTTSSTTAAGGATSAAATTAAAPATTAAGAATTAAAATTTAAAAATTVKATAAGGLESGLGSRGKNRKVVFVMDNPPTDVFWGTIQTGAKDAAKLYNIDLEVAFTTEGADAAKYNELIGTSAAKKPAAIAVVIRDESQFTENVCAAKKAGVVVMAYNVLAPGKVRDCVEGFIGQDFIAAGELIGDRMVKEAGIKEGDLVLLPVEQPDASYAKERGTGVKKALDKVKAKYEVIQAGAKGDAEALENMTQWLIGHPTVKAIIPMGGTPHRNALKALEAAKLDPAKVIVGGFDISKPITDGIAAGTIKAAVTQEPYIQGFQTVAELAIFIDFGIQPFSINTGAGIVDKANVATVAELAGKVR